MNHISVKSILVCLLGLSACTQFGGPIEEVVERSKARQPKWVEIAENKSKADDLRITYVSVRSHLEDLPLAVKETQLITLSESEVNLRGVITKKLSNVATEGGIQIVNVSAYHKIIQDKVRQDHSENASVTDIYYEKLQGGSSAEDFKEFYKVYVRVDYFKRHLADLLKNISVAFKSSPHVDLRQLSDKMTNSFEQLLGH